MGRCRSQEERFGRTRSGKPRRLDVETDENVGGVRVVEAFRNRSSNIHERVKKLTKVSRVLFEAHDDTGASQILFGHLQKTAHALAEVDVFVRSTDDKQGPRSHSRVLNDSSSPGGTERRERDGFAREAVDGRGVGEDGGQDGRLRAGREIEAVRRVIRVGRGQERFDGRRRRDRETRRRIVG